jgi:hypothetical protein
VVARFLVVLTGILLNVLHEKESAFALKLYEFSLLGYFVVYLSDFVLSETSLRRDRKCVLEKAYVMEPQVVDQLSLITCVGSKLQLTLPEQGGPQITSGL